VPGDQGFRLDLLPRRAASHLGYPRARSDEQAG